MALYQTAVRQRAAKHKTTRSGVCTCTGVFFIADSPVCQADATWASTCMPNAAGGAHVEVGQAEVLHLGAGQRVSDGQHRQRALQVRQREGPLAHKLHRLVLPRQQRERVVAEPARVATKGWSVLCRAGSIGAPSTLRESTCLYYCLAE